MLNHWLISPTTSFHHYFPCGGSPVLVRDTQQIHALRQASQVDFVGVLGRFHQLAYGVVDPDFGGGCPFNSDKAAGGVGRKGEAVGREGRQTS